MTVVLRRASIHLAGSCFAFLQAVLIVADQQLSLEVSGVGDVLESHDGILAVGSGGPYAAGWVSRRTLCVAAFITTEC